MVFLSISARRFWLFVGLFVLCTGAAVALVFFAFGWMFAVSPRHELAVIAWRVDPRQLQSWAVEILQQYPNGTNGLLYEPGLTDHSGYQGRLLLTNSPAFLRKIPRFGAIGPDITISPAGPETQRCVQLIFFYGGWGNGHTIVVGNPAFTMATNERCLQWAPGVYYRVW